MKREVYFMGTINVESLTELIKEILLLYNQNPNEEITLLMTSWGGSISLALSFYEWVKIKNIPLVTVAIGEVSSAGMFLFLSGKKRKATSNSFFILHKGGSVKSDLLMLFLWFFSHERYLDEKDWWRKVREIIKEILKKETKLSPEEIKKSLNRHLTLWPEEAKSLGIVHEIIYTITYP